MKKIILFALSLLLGIALFIGVLDYIGTETLREAFTSFTWPTIGLVLVLNLGQMAVVIYRWQMILEAQGDRVPYRKLISPKFVGFAISFLTPGLYVGGEPIRAYLLKKNTGIRMSKGLASIIVDKILDFTYPLPFLIAALIYAMFKYDISWEAFGVFALALITLIVLLGFFYIQTYRGRGFFSSLLKIFRLDKFHFLQKMINKMLYFEELIIMFFQKKPRLFVKGLLLSLLGGVLVFLQFVILLNALGIGATLMQILVMMVFMILSFLMPIPGSLGSFEAGQALVFNALKHPASIGVAFTLILRVAEIVKVVIGLVFLSNVGLKFLKGLPRNGDNNGETPITQDLPDADGG